MPVLERVCKREWKLSTQAIWVPCVWCRWGLSPLWYRSSYNVVLMSVFVSNSIFSCIIHGFCSPWKGNAQTKRVSWAPRLHSCHMLNIPLVNEKRKTIPLMFMMKRKMFAELYSLHCKWLCVDGKWVLDEVGSATLQHTMPHKLPTYCLILAEHWKDTVVQGEDFLAHMSFWQ